MTKPPNNIEFYKELLKNLYNIDVKQIKQLNSADDRNYYLNTNDSKELLLKVTNTEETNETGLLDACNAFILYLHNNGFKVTVPLINKNGKYIDFQQVPANNKNLSQQLSSNKVYGIRLLEYIPGKLLLNVPFTPAILRECGVWLANMHIALESFENPVIKKRKCVWGLLNVLSIRQYLDSVDNQLNRTLVSDCLAEFKSQVMSRLDQLDFGYIHGDFNEQNIIVDTNDKDSDEQQYHVSGVIDFGDAQYAPRVFDLAIHLAYAMLEFKAADQILAPGFGLLGYLQFRKLSEFELNVLFVCIKARLCQSLVLGAHSYRLDPTNIYFLSSAKNGWPALRALHNCNPTDILKKWLNIEKYVN